MKPRDGALLRYKGWRSHACLDACRIKSSLSEKMLTCGNAGEWCGSHGFPAPRGKGCTGSCSARLIQQKLPSIRTGVCHNSPKHLNPVCGHTLGCRRTFSCKRDVLQESCFVRGAADMPTIHAQNCCRHAFSQMHKPKLLGGVWAGSFSYPSPSRMSWLRCYR